MENVNQQQAISMDEISAIIGDLYLQLQLARREVIKLQKEIQQLGDQKKP